MHYLRDEGSKAHSKGGEGSKAHSKGGRVIKHTTQKLMLKQWLSMLKSKCIMIDMHVYLPEKYRPPFLHCLCFLSKVVVLVVNFDGFSTFAYSGYILWSWPLGRVWCHHTSLSFTLYLKSRQFCPTFSLEKESWRQPYHVCLIAPQLDHALQVFNLGLVWGEDMWK